MLYDLRNVPDEGLALSDSCMQCADVANTVGKGIVDAPIADDVVVFGALVGTLVASGFFKTAAAIVASPMLGMVLGAGLMIGVSWICRRQTPRRVDRWFRRLQLVSASLYSLGHGGNDAQKTIGMRFTKLRPVGGFCAETGGAITLFLATGLGIPVSTTHTITGAIVGVGSVRNAAAVRWGVAGNIVLAWVLTIPCSAAIATAAWWAGSRLL